MRSIGIATLALTLFVVPPAAAVEIERHFSDATAVVTYPEPGAGYRMALVMLPPPLVDAAANEGTAVVLRFTQVVLLDCNTYAFTTPSTLTRHGTDPSDPRLDYFKLTLSNDVTATLAHCPETLEYHLVPVPHDGEPLPPARDYVVYVPTSVVVSYGLVTATGVVLEPHPTVPPMALLLPKAHAWADDLGASVAAPVRALAHGCIDPAIRALPANAATIVNAGGGFAEGLGRLRETNRTLHDAVWAPLRDCLIAIEVAAKAWRYLESRAEAPGPTDLTSGAIVSAWACAIKYLDTLPAYRRMAVAVSGLLPTERSEIDWHCPG